MEGVQKRLKEVHAITESSTFFRKVNDVCDDLLDDAEDTNDLVTDMETIINAIAISVSTILLGMKRMETLEKARLKMNGGEKEKPMKKYV